MTGPGPRDLAHGLGGGSDLPIPADYAVLGGVAALTLTFAVLVMAWRVPRYESRRGGRPAPALLAGIVDGAAWRWLLRGLGLAVAAFTAWCLVAGEDSPATNPAFGIVYVLLWVGLVPLSLAFGPVVRAMSPVRALHALLVRALPASRRQGLVRLPDRVGYWPAAAGMLAFAWLELVSPTGTTVATLGSWLVGYAVLTIGGAVVFGAGWFERADPFEVYSNLVAQLSVWGRRDDGVLVVISPLRNLARTPVRPGLVAVVAVLLGSTAFDSFRESGSWVRFTQETTRDVELLETLLVVGAAVLVGVVFVAATASSRLVRGVARRSVPDRLAHSVVPIVIGYMAAHYLTLLVETGQRTFIQASDPLGDGRDLVGIADRQVDLWLSLHPTFLASVKVLAIVTGHVVGVVAAHDRALALLPRRDHATGQLPLLTVMVAYTFGGLYLLFGL